MSNVICTFCKQQVLSRCTTQWQADVCYQNQSRSEQEEVAGCAGTPKRSPASPAGLSAPQYTLAQKAAAFEWLRGLALGADTHAQYATIMLIEVAKIAAPQATGATRNRQETDSAASDESVPAVAAPSAVEEVRETWVECSGYIRADYAVALRHAEELDALRTRQSEAEALLREARYYVPRTLQANIERFLNDH